MMNVTPGGKSARLRPWHLPRPPPLTLSPSKPAVPAEKKDPAEAMRLLNMTTLEAEDTAYRIWVANFPEDDEEESEEE